MRVICINAGNMLDGAGKIKCPINLVEGEIYTVLSSDVSGLGTPYYILAEVKSRGIKGGYMKKRFMPLSNIDEMELLAERYGVYAENNFK